MSKQIEFELVTYDKPKMIGASVRLVSDFAKYTNTDWTRQWPRFLERVIESINAEERDLLRWKTPGLDISFSGFSPQIPTITKEGVRYSPRSPHFILEEDTQSEIKPVVREHLERVTKTIAWEMENEFKLEPQHDGPLTLLKFPNDTYAENISIVRAPII